jgi:hypothetical protein
VLRAFAHRDFRLFFAGQVISPIGMCSPAWRSSGTSSRWWPFWASSTPSTSQPVNRSWSSGRSNEIVEEPYVLGELEVLKQHDLDNINDAEAEKTFNEGMYYKRIGKFASAEFYFGKIVQRWPNSPWAIKAKSQQLQIEPKPGGRTRVEYFNFPVGEFY